MRVNENILISSLTTMRLGGPARYVIEIEKKEDLPDAYYFAKQLNLPTFVLGYGANTIGHDEGFNGVIIISRLAGITEEESAEPTKKIKAMSGEYWDNVVEYACQKNLTGIEGLSKIPGLVGAAPVQNIGAYGQQISDSLVEIEVFDSMTNTFKTMSNADLQFSYRKSILNTTEKGRYFVVSVTLQLEPGQMSRPFYNSVERYISEHNITDFGPQSIREIVSKIRAAKLPDPLEKPSSGSFFKNIYLNDKETEIAENKNYPVYHSKEGNKINSGWLIEQAGLKGQLLHGFRVSDTAALVLINESATSYEDLRKARDEIIGKVYDKFGYWLQQEPEELQ
ncbi:UDP-N-acetylmuramate dehydrogenase [Candidatus Saccharibacteria bacterium]|nr:UDP-N-acetylmuramate dehydrogenase [Candidatus Saccharibacteria bacterium]